MYELIFALFVYVFFGFLFATSIPIDWKNWKGSKLRWKAGILSLIVLYPLVIVFSIGYVIWNEVIN